MATAPLPTPSDIMNAPTVIKIPNTLIMEKDGSMAREWIYFFNDIGRAVDQQITANLPELTQQLIDNVEETLQLGSDADDIRTDIIGIKSDIATNTTNISTNTSGLATANTAITNQAGLISGLTTRLDTKDTEVSALQSTIATHTSDIAANTSNIQTHSTTLADLESRVAALESAP